MTRTLPTHPIAVAVSRFRGPLNAEPRVERALAQHFEHLKLFAKQQALDFEVAPCDAEQVARLRTLKYDAVLVGSLTEHTSQTTKHRDRIHRVDSLGELTVRVLLNGLFPLPMMIEYLIQEGFMGRVSTGLVVLKDLQLIDTASRQIIWEGEVSGSAHADGRASMTDEALKEAANRIVDHLVNMEFGKAGDRVLPERCVD